MSPDLFDTTWESAAARTVHYVDYVLHCMCYNDVMPLQSLTLTPFCLEKTSVRKKIF